MKKHVRERNDCHELPPRIRFTFTNKQNAPYIGNGGAVGGRKSRPEITLDLWAGALALARGERRRACVRARVRRECAVECQELVAGALVRVRAGSAYARARASAHRESAPVRVGDCGLHGLNTSPHLD